METNYRQLRNRCSKCGHRLMMHNMGGCVVENGEGHQLTPAPCGCKFKVRHEKKEVV